MNRGMGLACQKGEVEFLGPQRLAADIGERAILNAIAAGANRHDFDRVLAPAMGGTKRGRDHAGLGERKR